MKQGYLLWKFYMMKVEHHFLFIVILKDDYLHLVCVVCRFFLPFICIEIISEIAALNYFWTVYCVWSVGVSKQEDKYLITWNGRHLLTYLLHFWNSTCGIDQTFRANCTNGRRVLTNHVNLFRLPKTVKHQHQVTIKK